jgi:UrcA family protein
LAQAVALVPIEQPPPYEEESTMRQYLIALSAFAVVAASPVVARDFTVNYADLNLKSEQGQRALERRIDKAARDYCGVGVGQTGSRVISHSTRQCYQDARNAARQQIGELVEQSQLGG